MWCKIVCLSVLFYTSQLMGQDNRVKTLDSLFSHLYKEGSFNGNVLIAEKGVPIYMKSFGKADWASNRDLNTSSVFELASVSKQFTAMAVMILEEKGKLKYSDSLRKFFPQLPYSGITIRHLLNHTSGLPDYMELFEKSWDSKKIATNEDMIALLSKEKPGMIFNPGTKWEYSNTGYALLASIITKVSGKTFPDFLKENIFKPLGMTNSMVFGRRYNKWTPDNYAYGYLPDGKGNYVLADSFPATAEMVYSLDGIQGDGTVNSTLEDLLKWDRALYSGKLVSKKSFDEAYTAALLNDGKATQYGYGIFVVKHKDYGTIANHSGGWPGYMTFFERHLDNDKTIIILQNNGKSVPSMTKIRQVLYNIKPELPSEKETNVTELLPYVGSYELGPEFQIEVTVHEGKIYGQATGQEKFELFKEKTDLYFLKVVDAKVQFVRDANNKVEAMILFQNGREMRGAKVK